MAVALAIMTGGAAADDVKKGKKLFKSKCGICHSIVKGKRKLGPSLFSVVGKKAGTEPKYRYSSAMKKSNLTWNESSLDEYLANPRKKVPGTKMSFPGLKKESKRKAVIAYLKTLK
ncbi:MAG: cytochrome c family protein [Rhodospirillaceae bacterium]|nr:cytochrome c family protein [Rhodospirillaceae bacterium]|tara:strand:+ start:874 stop:1221 length:348 start_codon:yes stop_codon:yes gene_type:complete